MRSGLLSDLAVIGYEIFLEGDNIRYRYRKSGDPPDKVRPLIDELRKYKAEAVNLLRTGNTITPKEIVEPEAIVNAIWVNPRKQGTSEARKESLHQVMMAIWEPIFDRIAADWPRGFVSTQEIRTAEIEIARVQTLVLSGQAQIADFQKVVEAWDRICLEEIGGLKHSE